MTDAGPVIPRRGMDRPSFIMGCLFGLAAGATIAVLAGGLILRVVIPASVWDTASERVSRSKVENDLAVLSSGLEAYRKDFGRYPTTDEGLAALVNNSRQKYIGPSDIPKDAWERPYRYESPGAGGEGFAITTFGADGKPGGSAGDTDIVGTPEGVR